MCSDSPLLQTSGTESIRQDNDTRTQKLSLRWRNEERINSTGQLLDGRLKVVHRGVFPPIGLSGSLPDRGRSSQCGHYRHAHGSTLLRQLEFLAAFCQLPSVVTSPDL
jgi:hypothetical protein